MELSERHRRWLTFNAAVANDPKTLKHIIIVAVYSVRSNQDRKAVADLSKVESS